LRKPPKNWSRRTARALARLPTALFMAAKRRFVLTPGVMG
jgi:hypothetical protein